MGYGSFFFVSAALLILAVCAAWRLSRRRPGLWRSRLANAAVVLAALLTPLVVAEGWFLFFVDTTDHALATLTSRRWLERHASAPGGFRGRPFRSEESLSRGGPAIAVVGDSIAFGQGVANDQDLYSSILESELRARGAVTDVINISGPGWNLPEETAALDRHYEAGHTFDIVVLGFCLNDMGTFVKAAPGFREAIARLGAPPAPIALLVENAFVASYLYFRYAYRTSPAIKESWDKVAAAYQSPAAFLSLTRGLEAFKRRVESHGGRLVVLTFPDTSGPWERYRYRDFHRKLGEYWEWAGVTHIDLLPVFERHDPGSLQVGFMDTHPNALAHRLAAAELTGALAGILQLPGKPGTSATQRKN